MGVESEELKAAEEETLEPPADEQEEQEPSEAKEENENGADEEDVKDSHGQPGINKERHDKEIAEKNAKIAELEAQIAQAAETKAGREKLEKEIANLKADIADKDVTHSLEMAGCKSVKAAKALLEDFDGDVSKLKAEHPYLFGADKKTGSTGGKPEGASSAVDDKLDKAFGLK